MARLHSLIAWVVVFGFLAVANVSAADGILTKSPADKAEKAAKQPKDASSLAKKKLAKWPAKTPHSQAARGMPLSGNAVAIEEALAGPIQLDFNRAPLQDVIDYLKTTKNIEIQLDKRVLADVDITGRTPVTINVKGISLKAALRLMFRDMQPELTYVIADEVLLITTPDVAEEMLITRVYPVGDLVVRRDEHNALRSIRFFDRCSRSGNSDDRVDGPRWTGGFYQGQYVWHGESAGCSANQRGS